MRHFPIKNSSPILSSTTAEVIEVLAFYKSQKDLVACIII